MCVATKEAFESPFVKTMCHAPIHTYMHTCIHQATKEAFESPFVKTMCHAPSCTAEGPGLQPRPRADDGCMFLIQPRDRYGVPLRDSLGLVNFTVDVEDPGTGKFVPAKVIVNARMGNSVCYYDGSHAGVYYVHVYMQDFKGDGDCGQGKRTPVAGSPFK